MFWFSLQVINKKCMISVTNNILVYLERVRIIVQINYGLEAYVLLK